MKAKWAVFALAAVIIALAAFALHPYGPIRNAGPAGASPAGICPTADQAPSEWCIAGTPICRDSWFTDAAAVCRDNVFVTCSQADPQRAGNHDLVVSVLSSDDNPSASSVFQLQAAYGIQTSSSPIFSSMDSTDGNVYILFQCNGEATFGRSNGPLPVTIDDWVFDPLPAEASFAVGAKLKCAGKYAFACCYTDADYSVTLLFKDLERAAAEWQTLLIEPATVSESNNNFAEVYLAIAGDYLYVFYNVEENLIDIDLMYAIVSTDKPDGVLWRGCVRNNGAKLKWARAAASGDYVAGIFRNREDNSLYVAWLEAGRLAGDNQWRIEPVEAANRVGGSAGLGIRGDVLEVVYRDLDGGSLVCASVPVRQRNVVEYEEDVMESNHRSGTGISYLRTSAYEVVVFEEGLNTGDVMLAYKPKKAPPQVGEPLP